MSKTEVALKTIILPISESYVSHWGLPEAFRELVQNAIDNADLEAIKVEVNGETGNILVENLGTPMGIETLLLGESSKRDDPGKIGQFGEGYKLAMLVLARLGHSVRFRVGSELWVPSLVHSDVFDRKVLQINIEDKPEEHFPGVRVEIACVDFPELEETLKKVYLPLQEAKLFERTESGAIVDGQVGEVYCGGLHVFTSNTLFSYDFSPSVLPLGRDRKVASAYTLSTAAGSVLIEEGDATRIYQLLLRNSADTEYLYVNAQVFNRTDEAKKLLEGIQQCFVASHPGGFPYQAESKKVELKKQGFTHLVQVSAQLEQFLSSTGLTDKIKEQADWEDPGTPKGPFVVMENFLCENRTLFESVGLDSTLDDLRGIVEASKNWVDGENS